jgi:DUF4097 and DUF4098 domain-containing protein YvlB
MFNLNTYRNIFISAATSVLLATTGQAQDKVNVPLDDPSRPAVVKASVLNGGITVKGYEGKEVVVEAKVRVEREGRRRGRDRDGESSSEGMKRLNIATTGLQVEEEDNKVSVSTDSINRTIDITIMVPYKTSLILRSTNDGDIVVNNVDGELDVNNTNGEVTLSNVSGNAVAHALNGKVLVTFTRVNSKPMAFSSLNGDIDVTFPADFKANVSFSTGQGDVFSDFDVAMNAQASKPMVEERGKDGGGKYRVKLDKTVRGTINGGGPEVSFKNFNGGIYLRRAGAKASQ